MFRPNDTLGPYTLIRTLGRGAFGEVWLAERKTALLTTQVALKLPLVSEDDIETVRLEAALWLRASGHPNIVPVMEADVFDGQVVIASEFIAGGSLHEWMMQRLPPNEAPSIEEAVAMMSGILAGLDYLHRAGLTHRDLKPENVLLQDGIPRLTDFGLARVLKTEARTGNISGTPRYMAPETFSGSYSAVSDLWSVGIMLHELLTGSHPFPTGDLMALMAAIQGQMAAPLTDSVPKRLQNIVLRLLAKSPEDRFASASAVRAALQSCLQPVVSSVSGRYAATGATPHNLSAQTTSFIGREKETVELKDLLGKTRLLTLTGSGGCGKTRLALEVSTAVLGDFPDGVWLAEFAPLSDPSLVSSAIAGALKLREEPGRPILTTITDYLKNRSALLVLDNCEHVLEETPRVADSLLRACPKLKIITTSREALGVQGEQSYRIPSLALPRDGDAADIERLKEIESVRLFIDRAILAQPSFAVSQSNAESIAQICRRLDGIPLAIELAAARVRALAPEQIANRLDTRFRLLTGGSRTALPRQQTLRALIDWSYDLLTENEQTLLRRLSVFAGGWTLESAEKVCSDDAVIEIKESV